MTFGVHGYWLIPPPCMTDDPGVLSSQQRGGIGTAATNSATTEDEPLVLPLDELLAVRRCAEPSLPEGGGVWISTQKLPTVSSSAACMHTSASPHMFRWRGCH